MNKQLFLQLTIFILVLFILIIMTVLILNQFSPFRECEGKPDYYNTSNGWNCGDLRTINTSLAST